MNIKSAAWLFALGTALAGNASGQLTEESIHRFFNRKDRLMEQKRIDDVLELYTPDATVEVAYIIVSAGSSRTMDAREYISGQLNTDTQLSAHITTPVHIEIAGSGQAAGVENKLRHTMRPGNIRERTVVWYLNETVSLIYTNGTTRISSGRSTIMRQTLEPDAFYARVMALLEQDGGIDKETAIELLKETRCIYKEGDGKRRKTSVNTGFASYICGDEIPALALQIPDLQVLTLGFSSSTTDEGMNYVGQMKNLETFHLNSSEVTDRGLSELKGCTNLSSLILYGTAFTAKALEDIATLPNLQSLEVFGSVEAIKGLPRLAHAPRLEKLSLGIGLSDNDLALLADIPHLKTLQISGGNITDAGLHHFQCLEKLSSVRFKNTGITYAGTQKLKELCPELNIGPESLSNPCKYSLGSIEYAKVRWADKNKKKDGVLPAEEDLKTYLKHRGGWEAMTCQDNGIITVNPVGDPAGCSIHGKTRARKRTPQLDGLSKDDFDIDGAAAGRWTMDIQAAKTLAAEKQLPILLNFTGSDWCYWCRLMEKNVFTQPDWKTYAANNIVMVLIDFPRDKNAVPQKYRMRNTELKNQYGISGYPTFILLRPDGKTVITHLKAGRSKTPDSFIGEIRSALNGAEQTSPDSSAQLDGFMKKWAAYESFKAPLAPADEPLLLAALEKDPHGPWARYISTRFSQLKHEARDLDAKQRADHYRASLDGLKSARDILTRAVAAHPQDGQLQKTLSGIEQHIALASLEAGLNLTAIKAEAEAALAGNTDKQSWQYGNVIYRQHSLLGRIALRTGNIDEAEEHLLAAGRTPGSPQLNSFGPDFVLARELAEKGAFETVLEFLDSVARFWANPDGQTKANSKRTANEHRALLDSWKEELRNGRIPDHRRWK